MRKIIIDYTMSNPDSQEGIIDAVFEQIPTLAEARRTLLKELNDDITQFLQARNYPVGFDTIKLPVISDADLEGDKEKKTVGLSKKAKTRIIEQIQKDLEETYTTEKIQEKIQALETEQTKLQEELAQIPNQIKDLDKFPCHGRAALIAKRDADKADFQRRAEVIPMVIQNIDQEKGFLMAITPYSEEERTGIIDTAKTLLEKTLDFQEPEKIKKIAPRENNDSQAIDTLSATPSASQIKQARTLGFRTATLVAFIVLGGSLGTYQLWKNNQNNKRAIAAEVESKKSTLLRHPEVITWFGEEEAQKLSIQEIGEIGEKIELVQKHEHLKEKYAGEKIKEVRMLALLFEVPEEFKNYPYYLKKINESLQTLFQKKGGEMIDLFIKDEKSFTTNIITLLKDYIDLTGIPADLIKFDLDQEENLVAQFKGKSGPAEVSLVASGGKSVIAFIPIGDAKDIHKAIMKDPYYFIQEAIKKGDNGFEFMGQTLSEQDFIKQFEATVNKIFSQKKFGTIPHPEYIDVQIISTTSDATGRIIGVHCVIGGIFNTVNLSQFSVEVNFQTSYNAQNPPPEIIVNKLAEIINSSLLGHGDNLEMVFDGQKMPGMGTTRIIKKHIVDGWEFTNIIISPRVIIGQNNHRMISCLVEFDGNMAENGGISSHYGPINTPPQDLDMWLQKQIHIRPLDGKKITMESLPGYQEEISSDISAQASIVLNGGDQFGVTMQGAVATNILPGQEKIGDVTIISCIPTSMGAMNLSWTVKVNGPLDETLLNRLYPHTHDISNIKKRASLRLQQDGNIQKCLADLEKDIRSMYADNLKNVLITSQKNALGEPEFAMEITLKDGTHLLGKIEADKIRKDIEQYLRDIVDQDKTLSQVDWIVRRDKDLLDKTKVTTISGHTGGLQMQYLKDKGYSFNFEKSGIVFDAAGKSYLRLTVLFDGSTSEWSIDIPADGEFGKENPNFRVPVVK